MSNLIFMMGVCVIAKCISPSAFVVDDLFSLCAFAWFVDMCSFLVWRK